MPASRAVLALLSRVPTGPRGVEWRVLDFRTRHGWGAKKRRQVLERRHPNLVWPARSTARATLGRHGELNEGRRRKKWGHPGSVRLETTRPNPAWPVDFNEQLRTRDGRR